MKKNLLYLLALVCSVSMFASCDGKKNDDTPKIPAIAGTWNLAPTVYGEDKVFVSGPLTMIWDAPEGTMVGGADVNAVAPLVELMGGPLLSGLIKDVTFHQDGAVTVTYADQPEEAPAVEGEKPNWIDSGKGYATYKEINDGKQILLFVNLQKMVGDEVNLPEMYEKFPLLKQFVESGIPLNVVISSDKKALSLCMDKDMMDMLATRIEGILPLLPEGEDMEFIKQILTDMPAALKATTEFHFGLEFQKPQSNGVSF